MSTEATDQFEQRLDQTIATMQKCQQERGHNSCSQCEEYIGCNIRRDYVQAVYDSMSKGETGGFEF